MNNCSTKNVVNIGDSIEIKYNGILWLARDRHYSSQYLGSGRTWQQALNDMQNNIKESNFKYREELY